MRTVHTLPMVAHLFANQSQETARTPNHSAHFEGANFWSYRTHVASIAPSAVGPCLLLTTHKYSVTTSHHLSEVRRAFDGFRGSRAFSVPRVSSTPSAVDHAENLAHLVASYNNTKARLLRMRYESCDVSETLHDVAKCVADYCEAFRLSHSLTPASDAAEVVAKRAAARAKRETPAYIAKRERERAAKAAREAERMRLLRMSSEEKLRAWLGGADVYVPRYTSSPDVMRLHSNRREVETLRGARVPVEDARRLFDHLASLRMFGRVYARPLDDSGPRVGSFTLDSVDTEGNVRIGCHRFEWQEIIRFARVMGWAEGGNQ